MAVLLATVTATVNTNGYGIGNSIGIGIGNGIGFYGDGALSTVNPSRVRLRFTSIVNISDLLGLVLFFLLVGLVR